MKINLKSCTEEELWKYVAHHLSQLGIDSVLVGGAVVSIYSKGAYQSGDLDLIVSHMLKDTLPKAMKEIGFKKTGRHYVHPDCKHLFIEFPLGPLAIGDDIKVKPVEHSIEGKTIKILSPTDCIKDRLASHIHFKSRETLDQAVLVAQAQPFKISEIKRWCKNENAIEEFEEFCRLVKS